MVPADVPKRVAQAPGCQCHLSWLPPVAAPGLAHFWFGMRSSSTGCPGNARCSLPGRDNIWQHLLKILPNSAVKTPPVSHPCSSPGLKLGQGCPCWYAELALGHLPWVGGWIRELRQTCRPTSISPSAAQPAGVSGNRTWSQGQLVAFLPTRMDEGKEPWGGTCRHGRASGEGNDSLEFK